MIPIYSKHYQIQLGLYVMKVHKLKLKRLADYRVSFSILVLKFLQYFVVDMEKELWKVIKPQHKINVILHKMDLVKLGK